MKKERRKKEKKASAHVFYCCKLLVVFFWSIVFVAFPSNLFLSFVLLYIICIGFCFESNHILHCTFLSSAWTLLYSLCWALVNRLQLTPTEYNCINPNPNRPYSLLFCNLFWFLISSCFLPVSLRAL